MILVARGPRTPTSDKTRANKLAHGTRLDVADTSLHGDRREEHRLSPLKNTVSVRSVPPMEPTITERMQYNWLSVQAPLE